MYMYFRIIYVDLDKASNCWSCLKPKAVQLSPVTLPIDTLIDLGSFNKLPRYETLCTPAFDLFLHPTGRRYPWLRTAALSLQIDDWRFDDENSIAFQTRGDSVRVDSHRKRQLFVEFLRVEVVTPAARRLLRYHPDLGAAAAGFDQQSVGVDVSADDW